MSGFLFAGYERVNTTAICKMATSRLLFGHQHWRSPDVHRHRDGTSGDDKRHTEREMMTEKGLINDRKEVTVWSTRAAEVCWSLVPEALSALQFHERRSDGHGSSVPGHSVKYCSLASLGAWHSSTS